MIWCNRSPVYGDMLRIKAGSIYHYGIYVSENEVIQFGLAPIARPTVKDCDVAVCCSDLDTFRCNAVIEIGEPEESELPLLRSREEIVQCARSRIGEKKYNILYNNCEHFVYECVLGIKYCSQTERVRSLFRSLPLLDVYVAKIPEQAALTTVYPPERNQEILSCQNRQVKIEKYYVWKLLEYALYRSFGRSISSVQFQKAETGKWQCDICEFSLSHSHHAVAVAISRKPVGIDIQLVKPLLAANGIAKRILSEMEHDAFIRTPPEEQPLFLLQRWTEKESIFKSMNRASFFAADPKSFSKEAHTRFISMDQERYSLSVASENLDRLRYYDKIDLT